MSSFLKLKSSEEEEFEKPYLEIKLIEGSNLIASNKSGYSDPYIIIKSGLNKIKSKTMSKTLNPQFNQNLKIFIHPFEIKDEGDLESKCGEKKKKKKKIFNGKKKKKVECWNHNLLKSDDFMGKTKIELNLFKKDEEILKFNEKLEQVEKGRVILEIKSFNFDLIKEETKKIRNQQKEIILEKLLQSVNHSSKSNEIILKMAKILSDKELLKENYITTNWLDALKKQQEVLNEVELDSEIKTTNEIEGEKFEEQKKIDEEEENKFEKEIKKNQENEFLDDIKIEKEQENYQLKKRKSSVAINHQLKKD